MRIFQKLPFENRYVEGKGRVFFDLLVKAFVDETGSKEVKAFIAQTFSQEGKREGFLLSAYYLKGLISRARRPRLRFFAAP